MADESPAIARWLVVTLWIMLACLLLSLVALSAYLLVKMNLFSAQALTDEQIKSLWAFLGVAIGAAVTLIGTLLTEQHKRRTDVLAAEMAQSEAFAKAKEQALAEDAERRRTLDVVAEVLQLITTDGTYAPTARVGGAIAMMVQLGEPTVSLRILGELWTTGNLATSTAVWLIERVLQDPEAKASEVEAAADALARNAWRVVPTEAESDQHWEEWPEPLWNAWPSQLSEAARNSLFFAAVKVLFARGVQYWKERPPAFPVATLSAALDDEQFGPMAARVLMTLFHAGVLDDLRGPNEHPDSQLINVLSKKQRPTPWFQQVLSELAAWARDEKFERVPHKPPARVAATS